MRQRVDRCECGGPATPDNPHCSAYCAGLAKIREIANAPLVIESKHRLRALAAFRPIGTLQCERDWAETGDNPDAVSPSVRTCAEALARWEREFLDCQRIAEIRLSLAPTVDPDDEAVVDELVHQRTKDRPVRRIR